ncbi:putative purple acid phosphatase precursor [Acidisarcina polymorpha]|uniref:Putative purple acid phosphatase n=1 Tax=Acidisarcina polymorpha TaxID=2211140 RepID=A0A2Z5G766_9BACT|nr:metallophosphoesterase [Acidisarcina polymorpha]AXC14921.1 putative purple acid phosphatase precursor [Acidisarcina polymorpha]
MVARLFLCSLSFIAGAGSLAQDVPADDLSGKPTFVVGAIRPGQDLKIIVYGDMRFTAPSNTTDTNPRVRKWLVDRIAEEKPDALFVSGDLPFQGGLKKDWEVYRQETAPWIAANLRVYPALGNHELVPLERPGLANYFDQFSWLGDRRWYSVQIGSVYLIALDTNSGHPSRSFNDDAPQQRWLASQLAHLPPEINFVFFLTHMPLINDLQSEVIADIPQPAEIKLRRYLEGQAALARAKFIVVSGHVHNYERFEHGGISYIVSGGGGAKPYPLYLRSSQDLYRDPANPNFNYVVLEVSGTRAEATMYRVADPKAGTLTTEVKERFTLTAK